ncbi:MAG: HAMP domain-containing histidine kinase [Actinomycetota bacterium]|nr:HAMP domain-containing histidine kinase [Actinomycetota bacterium]
MTTDATDPVAVTTAHMTGPATVTATSRRSAYGAGPDAGSEQRPAKPRRRGASARLQIMGWLVLVLAAALVSVVLVTRNVLINGLEQEISAALSQEVEEFRQFEQQGRNPETGQPFTSAVELLQVHLERQRTGESEVLAGISATAATPPLVEGQANAERAINEPGMLTAIETEGDPTGALSTNEGELRWARVPIHLHDTTVDGYFVVGFLVTPEVAEVNKAVRTLALVSLLGLILAAGVSWIVAGQILAPVRLLHRTAAQIREDDLTRRIPVRGNDDIAALAEQFNAMLERLQAAFAAQREFLDDASHELRTPITIIRGTLELLGDDPSERTEDLRLCLDELDRMSRIVDDLLLLAKSERPDFVRLEPVDLAELTSDIDAKVRALGERRWQLEAIGEGTVRVDPQRITQAMVQLAHNAVQHTKPGDAITIGSALQLGTLTFWITDSGPGVPPEDSQAIFERFSRGSTGGARTHRVGAGLGLAIVRAIADAHGGAVRLRSVPGQGATFVIDIPAETAVGAKGETIR